VSALEACGLDLSLTATGVAWPDGTSETITTKAKTPMPKRLAHIRDYVHALWLNKCCHRTFAIVEDLPFTRNNAAGQLGMVHGIVRVALDELIDRGLCAGVVLVVPGCLKKYATGTGNANKQQMLAEAIRRLGYAGADDNQVDALWLRQMGLAHYAPELAVPVPVKHLESLAKVPWAELKEGLRV